MKGKTTLVLGASLKPDRYSNMAVRRLRAAGHEVIACGRHSGMIVDVVIKTDGLEQIEPQTIHTLTIYMRPELQEPYKQSIKKLQPDRVIFNPGTEHERFMKELNDIGIDAFEACTLVMLNTNQF